MKRENFPAVAVAVVVGGKTCARASTGEGRGERGTYRDVTPLVY